MSETQHNGHWALISPSGPIALFEEIKLSGIWYGGWASGVSPAFEDVRRLWGEIQNARDKELPDREKSLLDRWVSLNTVLINPMGVETPVAEYVFHRGGLCAFRLMVTDKLDSERDERRN